jgi:hypothetical protein
MINALNAKLNSICHFFFALLGAHYILHVSRIRVNHANSAVKITKCRGFLELLSRLLALYKGLCSMNSVEWVL